mmetsp:Transcript_63772/g.197442  ORF Transcript_63772/g.197442 Transcript_63772/m.197442 type:complete len:209 (-) Transcript_63772:374-1000(-)
MEPSATKAATTSAQTASAFPGSDTHPASIITAATKIAMPRSTSAARWRRAELTLRLLAASSTASPLRQPECEAPQPGCTILWRKAAHVELPLPQEPQPGWGPGGWQPASLQPALHRRASASAACGDAPPQGRPSKLLQRVGPLRGLRPRDGTLRTLVGFMSWRPGGCKVSNSISGAAAATAGGGGGGGAGASPHSSSAEGGAVARSCQ